MPLTPCSRLCQIYGPRLNECDCPSAVAGRPCFIWAGLFGKLGKIIRRVITIPTTENILIYSVNKQRILVINIKNSATCFGSLSHHQAKHKTQYRYSQCTHYGIPYCLQNYTDIKDHILFY